MAIVIIVLILAAVYLLAIRCRSGHPGFPAMQGFNYAHRGLHNKPQVPENSMAAFRAALDKGATANKLFAIPAREKVGRAKMADVNTFAADFDAIIAQMKSEIDEIVAGGEE